MLVNYASPGNYLVEFFPWVLYIPASLVKWKREANTEYWFFSRLFTGMFCNVETQIASHFFVSSPFFSFMDYPEPRGWMSEFCWVIDLGMSAESTEWFGGSLVVYHNVVSLLFVPILYDTSHGHIAQCWRLWHSGWWILQTWHTILPIRSHGLVPAHHDRLSGEAKEVPWGAWRCYWLILNANTRRPELSSLYLCNRQETPLLEIYYPSLDWLLVCFSPGLTSSSQNLNMHPRCSSPSGMNVIEQPLVLSHLIL